MRVALCCLVAMTTLAGAETPTERADSMFKRGKELMAAKRFGEACTAFDRSFQIEASTATLLNHADCREKNNQLATAWKLFVEVKKRTRDAADEASKQMNTTARTRSDTLEPRLSRLTIRVGDDRPAGFKLYLGDEELDPETFERALDGGKYTVRASEPGVPEWSKTIVVAAENDDQVIDVPAFERNTGKVVKLPVEEPRPAPSQSRPGSWKPIVAAGVGVALGAAAFIAWRAGANSYDQAELEPDDTRQEQLWNEANNRRYLAQGLAIGAAASAAVTVVLLVRGRKPESAKTAIVPATTTSQVGVALIHRW